MLFINSIFNKKDDMMPLNGLIVIEEEAEGTIGAARPSFRTW
jgi:hypothetical protein